VVIGRAAHVFDIAGPQALLAGGRPREFQFHFAQEMVLELVHAGGREQHGGVPPRHEHVASFANVPFRFKERQVAVANFVGFHAVSIAEGRKTGQRRRRCRPKVW
jgi:hypothetical protein